MKPEYTPPMSGSNSICVATVLLDTGLVEMHEPVTEFGLEVRYGRVDLRTWRENDHSRSVQVKHAASFTDRLDASIELAGRGRPQLDAARGGDRFVIVDAGALGFPLPPDEVANLERAGTRISAADEPPGISHPDNPGRAHISFRQFAMPLAREQEQGLLASRDTVAIGPDKLERSPADPVIRHAWRCSMRGAS